MPSGAATLFERFNQAKSYNSNYSMMSCILCFHLQRVSNLFKSSQSYPEGDVVEETQNKGLSVDCDSASEQIKRPVSRSVHPAINCIESLHSIIWRNI